MRRKETDLLYEGVHLFIGSATAYSHSLYILSPADQNSEPCGFDQFAELADFGSAEFRYGETRAGKVFRRSLRGLFIKTADEFLIVEHVLLHFRVLTPDRAVHDGCADAFLYLPSGTHRKRAVYDREPGFVLFDVRSGSANEIRELERVADMQYGTGAIDLYWRNVHTLTVVGTAQNLQQGVPNFPQASHDYDFIRQSRVYHPFVNLALACPCSVCLRGAKQVPGQRRQLIRN